MANIRAALIIEDVLAGRIIDRLAFAVRVSALAGQLTPDCASALHQAGHFLDDADLRCADAQYDSLMRSELEKESARLRSDMSPAA